MDVEDDVMESSISSLILSSIESNQRGEVLSSEDIAWVDSCLVKDPGISESSWDSLKDSLLEILSSQPRSIKSSAAISGDFPEGTDAEILPSWEKAETLQFPGTTDHDLVIINKEVERDGDYLPLKLKNNNLQPLTFEGNQFLPTYTEGMKESESIEPKLDLGSSAYEMEPSTEYIFRVWDWDIPAEEDELGKQLNKALIEESFFESLPSTFSDSEMSKDLEEESLDKLITGMADLSLDQKSS